MQQSLFAMAIQNTAPTVDNSVLSLDTPIAEAVFTVIDTETTGAQRKTERLDGNHRHPIQKRRGN